ncbi:hypothetical protein KKB18_03600, partial [bacterium]|nr:hypothetical protein [bacterium]
MPKKIILFSTELLPMGNIPATGWGVRGKGILESLKVCGFELYYSPLKSSIKSKDDLPVEVKELAFDRRNIDGIIKDISPDVVIFCPWPAANELDKTDVPVVIDLGGPIILENLHIPEWDIIHPLESKVEALSKGDFFTFGNKRQKYYFYLWLILSGVNLTDQCFGIVPITMPPELPEHLSECFDRFVTGGVFYPWQNPFPAINAVIKGMEDAGAGRLKIYRGKHPTWDAFPGIFKDPADYIIESNMVEYANIVPYDKLLEDYKNQGVAIDLYEENFERELAAPNRTITYLWCGIPVITSGYFEISEDIREYDAGWVVNPSDEGEIRKVTKYILENPEMVKMKSQNAQRLTQEKYTWGKNINTLEEFCKKPFKLDKKENMLKRVMSENSRIKFEILENLEIKKEFDQLELIKNNLETEKG